jgi:hypothetical protein
MSDYDTSYYKTPEWFRSLEWQHPWIEKMAGWWVGTYGKPATVLDLGAGDGWWAKSFNDMGSTCWAVELYEEAREFIPPQVYFIQHDLTEPVWLSSQGDLVICLEVAEHLPKPSGGVLVQNICTHAANNVLFSSAAPGQAGTGHINLQPQKYWRDAFEALRFGFNAGMTAATRLAFQRINKEVFQFLPPNIQVFSRLE